MIRRFMTMTITWKMIQIGPNLERLSTTRKMATAINLSTTGRAKTTTSTVTRTGMATKKIGMMRCGDSISFVFQHTRYTSHLSFLRCIYGGVQRCFIRVDRGPRALLCLGSGVRREAVIGSIAFGGLALYRIGYP